MINIKQYNITGWTIKLSKDVTVFDSCPGYASIYIPAALPSIYIPFSFLIRLYLLPLLGTLYAADQALTGALSCS